MVLGVPLFATILAMADRYLEKKLKAKGLPTDTKDYYAPPSAARRAQKQRKRRSESEQAIESVAEPTETLGLSEFEAFQLETYRLAKKHHIFFDDSDEARDRFAKEEALLRRKSKPDSTPPADPK